LDEEQYVRLDRYTIRSLELCEAMNEGGKSLLSVIDRTQSAMGGRLMRRWLLFPLKQVEPIRVRQDITEFFFKQPLLTNAVRQILGSIGDLERIASKIAVGRVSPREMVYLKNSLKAVNDIRQACLEGVIDELEPGSVLSLDTEDTGYQSLRQLVEGMQPCTELRERIQQVVVDNPPIALNRGEVIRSGVDAELDELRMLSSSGKEYLMAIQ